MSRYKYLLFVIIVFLFLFGLWFFYLRDVREHRLIEEGNLIIGRIEEFRSANNRLPYSLEEIGIVEYEGPDAIYYGKQDSLSENYMVWFGTSLGESKTYFSDIKKWEDHYRQMK